MSDENSHGADELRARTVEQQTADSRRSTKRAQGPRPTGNRDEDIEPRVVPLLREVNAEKSQSDPDRFGRIDRNSSTAELAERYQIESPSLRFGTFQIGETAYRFRANPSRIAFTESNARLTTDQNNPAVARAMVTVAQARGWQTVRISGHEDFRRMVWLEASLRDLKSLGHEPGPEDSSVLQRERERRAVSRVEPTAGSAATKAADSANGSANSSAITSANSSVSGTQGGAKSSARGSGSRKSVLAALEAVLVAQGVNDAQREAVMGVATEQLARRVREGQTLKVKVYDPAAPSHRPGAAPTRDISRDRERAAPAR